MGNCPPLPCPSTCPDLSFQDICANNNCHGCCIFHCSNPSVPPESPPAWECGSPPSQPWQQPPHLSPAPRPGSAAAAKRATARDISGAAPQDAPAYGYRFRPSSPWHTESGLVATWRATDRGSGGAALAPPGVPPGYRDRPVPSLQSRLAGSGATGYDAGGVPRHGHPRSPPSSRRTEVRAAETGWATGRADGSGVERSRGQPAWRTESGLAETWATPGRDAGAAVPDDTAPAAPLGGVPGNGDRPVPSLSPRPAVSGLAGNGATGHVGGGVHVLGHGDQRAPPPPPSLQRIHSGSAETPMARNHGQPVQQPTPPRAESGFVRTWATGRDDAGAAAPGVPLAVAVESGQDSGMRRENSSPAAALVPASRSRDPQWRSPSPSLSAARFSRAESRRSFQQTSGAEGTTTY